MPVEFRKVRRPYSQALRIAEHIQNLLTQHCKDGFCLIAGSIRRKADICDDVEIVCLPKTVPGTERNLFGFKEEAFRVEEWSNAVIEMCKGRVVIGDPSYGRYTRCMVEITGKGFIPGPCQVDIFTPQPEDFFRQYAIRTGSPQFSGQIARRWVAKGWRGTEDGLRLQGQCLEKGGRWQVKKGINPALPPAWQSEEEFFRWIGMLWVEPELR